jgi:hypothetical protein
VDQDHEAQNRDDVKIVETREVKHNRGTYTPTG